MNERTSISIPTDPDGFISRKCHACSKLFKIHIDDSGQSLAHCPYCHAESDDWFTDEQWEYVKAVGHNFAREVVAKKFGEMARNFNRRMPRRGFIKVKMSYKSSRREPLPSKPVEVEGGMAVHTFSCCNEPVKHDGSADQLFCIICGQSTAVSPADQGQNAIGA